MANFRYQQNVDTQARFTRLALQLDNGLTALLELGKTYTLTTNEVVRAGQYIVLVSSSDPVENPFQKVDVPVIGALDDGDYIVWNSSSRAFVGTSVVIGGGGGGGGGVTGPIHESDLDLALAAKIDARGYAAPISLGSVNTNQTITLTNDMDQQILDVGLTLTGNITLIIAGLSSLTFITIRIIVKQDAIGGRTFIVKELASGQQTTITNLDTSVNGQTRVDCWTDDGITLNVGQPPAGGGGSSLPAATKTGDRLVLDSANSPSWKPPIAASGIDLGPYGVRIFHRGAGYFAEDDSLRAIRVSERLNRNVFDAIDGGDWRLNASGSVVVMHDTTTARTCTTNLTVASATDTQWRALQLTARTPAQPTTESPPFAADVLDLVKQLGLICTPELKVTGNSTLNAQALGLIQARGMEKQCIVGSALLGDLAVFKAAGVLTMYIVDNAPDTQANILAADPDFFSFNHNRVTPVSDTLLQALSAAGIRIGAWTLDSRKKLADVIARLDGLGIPLQHYYSNALPWVSNTNVPPTRTRDPFSQGLFWPGMVPGQSYDSAGLDTTWNRGTFIGSPYRFALKDVDNQSFVLQSWMTPPVSATSSITVDITFDNVGSSNIRWASVTFNAPDDTPQWDGSTNAQRRGQGYEALLRVTGSLELYRRNADGTTTTQLGASQATAAVTTGQTVTLKIEPNLASNQIRVTRTDAGGFTPITVTDATYRPAAPFTWFGKFSQAGENFQVSFANAIVVP